MPSLAATGEFPQLVASQARLARQLGNFPSRSLPPSLWRGNWGISPVGRSPRAPGAATGEFPQSVGSKSLARQPANFASWSVRNPLCRLKLRNFPSWFSSCRPEQTSRNVWWSKLLLIRCLHAKALCFRASERRGDFCAATTPDFNSTGKARHFWLLFFIAIALTLLGYGRIISQSEFPSRPNPEIVREMSPAEETQCGTAALGCAVRESRPLAKVHSRGRLCHTGLLKHIGRSAALDGSKTPKGRASCTAAGEMASRASSNDSVGRARGGHDARATCNCPATLWQTLTTPSGSTTVVRPLVA